MNYKMCAPQNYKNGFPTIFDQFLNQVEAPERRFRPATNIAEQDDKFLIELIIPGIPKDAVKIELKDDTLTVGYESNTAKEMEGVRYSQKEFKVRSFSRKFRLPENIQTEQIKAQFENGMLCIHLPKKEMSKSESHRTIPVE